MTGVVHVVPGGPDPVSVTIVPGPPMAFSPAEITVGVGGTVTWINNTEAHHTVTSTQGAAMPKPRSECADDPGNACCVSCIEPVPDGCSGDGGCACCRRD